MTAGVRVVVTVQRPCCHDNRLKCSILSCGDNQQTSGDNRLIMVLCVVILNLWLTAGVCVVVPIDSCDDTRLIAGIRAVMTGIFFCGANCSDNRQTAVLLVVLQTVVFRVLMTIDRL